MRDAESRVTMWLGSNTDIDDIKRAQEAMRKAKEQLTNNAIELERLVDERTAKLQETIGELEAFSYSITHDLRSPLRAMQSFCWLLAEECGDAVSATGRDYIRRITTASERMDKLIQDTLNYSRLMRIDLPLVPVDLDAFVRGIIETYPTLQPPRVSVEVEGTLPTVRANHAALTQCVANLLDNAVKFVAPGVTPQVRVSAAAHDGCVRLNIRDNGIGIKAAAHEKIFQMFQRLSTRYDGTGIGLSIVKKAAERMGGSVGLESEPDCGSTFWLELPAARMDDSL
jgi:signal transduction histidine kinase